MHLDKRWVKKTSLFKYCFHDISDQHYQNLFLPPVIDVGIMGVETRALTFLEWRVFYPPLKKVKHKFIINNEIILKIL